MIRHLSFLATITLASIALTAACGNRTQEPVQDENQETLPASSRETADGNTIAGQSKILVSKGIIRSASEVRIFSRIEGQLMDINLKEGQFVKKGAVLFQLDDWDLKSKYQMSESEYEQARLRMEEILIGQGFKRNEFDKVPENVRKYARIKSGLNLCEERLSYHKSRLEQAKIASPISGIVTGIKPLPYSFVEAGETLCTIVDPNHLVVTFSVLETELGKFSKGSKIEVVSLAYPDINYVATVSSIQSVVDENGMIEIEAEIKAPYNLLPGMTAIVNL